MKLSEKQKRLLALAQQNTKESPPHGFIDPDGKIWVFLPRRRATMAVADELIEMGLMEKMENPYSCFRENSWQSVYYYRVLTKTQEEPQP